MQDSRYYIAVEWFNIKFYYQSNNLWMVKWVVGDATEDFGEWIIHWIDKNILDVKSFEVM